VKARRLPERPPGFTYKSGLLRRRELFAEEIAVAALAKKYGTPLYVYSREAIGQRYEQFDAAFAGQDHTICYSVKANSNLSVLKLLAGMGAGFDVVSGGELQRVLAADRRAAKKVVFSGVGKQEHEIDLALRSGILLFNVESASELRLLAARAAHLRKPASFAVRVNPDVNAQTHPYISTGLHEHKFGVPLGDARELYKLSSGSKYLKAAGVSAHIGSQITELSPFRESMEKIAEFVGVLREDGYEIRYVDAGGGLGIGYRSEDNTDFASEVKSYAAEIAGPLQRLGIHLLLEPGRSIVGPAGILVTRVVYKKKNNRKLFLIIDAAMNDLLRPALYDAYHAIVPVKSPRQSGKDSTADVVGPICESSDFFARRRDLPDVEEGELLAVLDAGAYGMVLASNYNTRPRAAEVLVEGKRARLIRRRENIDDLLGLEKL
jgi:diaminopimelate decarboxylase